MEKSKYTEIWISGIILSLILFMGCTADYPYPDPDASFEIWGINPETNSYEQVEEPYVLLTGVSYDFVVEGEGQQFVFWFGVPGDTTASTPKGSDFNDRGRNRLSRGSVALNNKAKTTYKTPGVYTLVFVASSYSYFDEDYKEVIQKKEIEVIDPTVK